MRQLFAHIVEQMTGHIFRGAPFVFVLWLKINKALRELAHKTIKSSSQLAREMRWEGGRLCVKGVRKRERERTRRRRERRPTVQSSNKHFAAQWCMGTYIRGEHGMGPGRVRWVGAPRYDEASAGWEGRCRDWFEGKFAQRRMWELWGSRTAGA